MWCSPPTAAWLFLPFRVVGYSGLLALWAGVMVWSVRHAAPWTWPIMALILALPPSILAINAGNPTVLVAITVALALRWPVFGPLALLKPTMAPFAFTRHTVAMVVGRSRPDRSWDAAVHRGNADLPPGHPLDGGHGWSGVTCGTGRS